jgi:hypothetical protein
MLQACVDRLRGAGRQVLVGSPFQDDAYPDLVRVMLTVEQDPEVYTALLWCLVAVNVWSLNYWDDFPPLRSGFIAYAPEEDEEEFRSIPSLYAHGEGDCDDLAAADVAFDRVAGIDSIPVLELVSENSTERLFHVVVHREEWGPTGPTIVRVDPSAELSL